MGFRTREVMMGTHEFRPDWGPEGTHTFGFRGSWGPDSVRAWLNPTSDRFLWQEFEGEVFVGGLCDWTPVLGTLEMQYFTKRRLRYSFDFEVGDQAHDPHVVDVAADEEVLLRIDLLIAGGHDLGLDEIEDEALEFLGGCHRMSLALGP